MSFSVVKLTILQTSLIKFGEVAFEHIFLPIYRKSHNLTWRD